jgi:hypothetical protein
MSRNLYRLASSRRLRGRVFSMWRTMGILVAVVVFLALIGSIKKSAAGRLLLFLMFIGGIYVFYWKWTTGGF